MSVWCSRLVMDGEPGESPAPLVYVASHVIPSANGARGGGVDTAHLPGFITRDGRDNGTPDDEDRPWWPFLRLSVRPSGAADDAEDTVVLDAAQVDALIADLTDWRANADETRR